MNFKKKIELIKISKNEMQASWYYNFLAFFHQKYLNITETIKLRIYRFLKRKENFYENPLITVFTPTYNRAEILCDRAIKSVLNQTYKNFEYIIVGDGCDDNTEDMVKKINDPRIKFYNIERKILYKKNIENLWFVGPVRAINFAISKAKGKWIARIDDDVSWDKYHLEKSLNFCKKNKFEFVTAAVATIRFGKKKAMKYETINNKIIGGSNTFFYISYLRFFKFNLFCWMRKFYRVNDVDLFDRMTRAGVKTGFREEVSLYASPRPNEETMGLDQIILKKEEYKKKYFKKS